MAMTNFQDENHWQTFTFKYVVVGDCGVGKTCLVDQFTQKRFQEAYLTTIGISLAEVTRTIQVDGRDIRLEVWDTAGMEVYRSLTSAYYRNTAVTLLVYDVTRRESFESLGGWLQDIRQGGTHGHMVIMLVGNKIDLVKERQVKKREGQEFATRNQLFFLESSAKILETVEKIFFLTARIYFEKIDVGDIDIDRNPGMYGVKVGEHEDHVDLSEGSQSNQNKNCLSC